MALSETEINALLDDLATRGVFVSAHTAVPTDATPAADEVSGGTYARKAITWNAAASKNLGSSIAPVLNMLRTILVAVPALRRVEPASISGPTSSSIGIWHTSASGAPRLQQTPMVVAASSVAYLMPPSTYGVRPLAVMPTTASW